MLHRHPAFRPSSYEIFDEDYSETGEVVIWSRATLTPRLGDHFNIDTHGELRDVTVAEVRTFRGGWSITCREGA
jgi:hypothetical protein